MKQQGMSPTFIIICLQTREVHRNCNAPRDYTYKGSIKKREVTIELLMELPIALHIDITKAAKGHGLGETH